MLFSRWSRGVLFTATLFVALTPPLPAAAALARLLKIDHHAENNRTRVVLRVTRQVDFDHGEVPLGEEPGMPRRLFIDLKQTRLPDPKGEVIEFGDVRVSRVRTGQYDATTARVVLDLADPASTYKVFFLNGPFRVVLDVFGAVKDPPPPPAPPVAEVTPPEEGSAEGGPSIEDVLAKVDPQPAAPPSPDPSPIEDPPADVGPAPTSTGDPARLPLRRLVLDPGHGGDQPGAVGKTGLKEKDVVLDVSKRLKRMAERTYPGIEVFLTRDDDRTLGLEDRTAFANSRDADLFISIHANAHPRRSRYGVEVFYLNVTADRYANRLAQVENKASGKNLSDLQFILADLTRMANVEESRELARYLQGGMMHQLTRGWDKVKDLGVKNALFYVLLGAKMPACLAEISFISNLREEERLKDAAYLEAIAAGLLDGIEAFVARGKPQPKD